MGAAREGLSLFPLSGPGSDQGFSQTRPLSLHNPRLC